MATSSPRGLRAGRAVIELSLLSGGIQKQMQAMSKRMQSFGASMTRVGAMGMAAGGAIAGAFIQPIRAASDMAETIGKFSAVFGDQAKAAGDFADELAARVGRSSTEIRDSMSATQAMFVGMGIDPAKAREMSQQLAELGIDMASFHNLSDQEASSRFLSALGGSTEVLEKFGVNIKAAAMNEKLLEMGINKTNSQATEQEKLFARVAIIAESLGAQGAIGDATTTAGSFGNQMKRLKAIIGDTMAAIGQSVLPAVTKFMRVLNTGASFAKQFAEAHGGLFRTVGMVGVALAAGGAAFVALGASLSLIGVAIGGFLTALSAVGGVLAAIVSPIGLVVAGLGGLATWFLTSTEAGQSMVASLSESFSKLLGFAKSTFAGISSAMTAGDLALAGRIAWASIKVAWLKGTQGIRETWHSLVAAVLKGWNTVNTGLAIGITVGVETIKRAWSHSMEFLLNSFDGFMAGFKKAWNSTVAFFQRTWQRVKELFGAGVADEIAKINAELKDANAKVDAKREKRTGERTTKAEKERTDSSKRQNEIVADLGRELNDKFKQIDTKRDDKVAKAQEELLRLEQKRRDAIESAHEAAQADQKAAKKKVVPAAAVAAKAIAAAVGGGSGGTGGGGLFDTRFARQMLVGPQDRQEQLLGKIEKNTRGNGGIAVA